MWAPWPHSCLWLCAGDFFPFPDSLFRGFKKSVILFWVLVLSGLETLASWVDVFCFGIEVVIGDLLNATGTADAGTNCHANLWMPGKGCSFAKSKPHLWLSNSNCLANSLSTNLLFSSLSVQPNKFLLTPSRAVTPRTRSDLVSSTVVVACRPGALTLKADISIESKQRNTTPINIHDVVFTYHKQGQFQFIAKQYWFNYSDKV